MNTLFGNYTAQENFYGKNTPSSLLKEFGSPLYVYSERIMRERCNEMKNLVKGYKNFRVNYSAKANTNPHLLSIVRSEGLLIDAMSPGEIMIELKAGFSPEDIFYIGNNVSEEELRFAVVRGITVSVDSISQLETFGKAFPGKNIAVRMNPGIGAGHHKKVVTAGKGTKFGVDPVFIPEMKAILKKYSLRLAGINQHIGSLFMEPESYIDAATAFLAIASQFDDLDFVDMGGGFGIPYHKQEGQKRLDLASLGEKLSEIILTWTKSYGKEIIIKIEPGRYLSAECGVLLGTVHSVKENYGGVYAGTDIGFNVLMRPVLYDSYHEFEVYREGESPTGKISPVTITGNICETGDILASDRMLPELRERDILGVMDAGAYGHAMSSNYNARLRPAEVLITPDGSAKLIRRRDTFDDLMNMYDV